MGRVLRGTLGSYRKSSAGGSGPGSARDGRDGEPDAELTADRWLEIWAFGTSPYGLGLTARQLWGLCSREHDALIKVRTEARERDKAMLAALRADLHNTSARQFERHFDPADFMPGSQEPSLEARIHALVEEGYTPSEAAAMATSSQTREHRLYLVDSAIKGASAATKRRRA